MTRSSRLRNVCFLVLAGALAGCTTGYYRRSADKEASAVIAQKTGKVPNMDSKFGIKPVEPPSLEGLPLNQKVEEFMGTDGEAERGAPVLSLEKALEIAVHHSPSYQDKKEELYFSALNLTLARHKYTPIFSAGSGGVASKTDVAGIANMDWLMRDLGRLSVATASDLTQLVTRGGGIGGTSLGATLTRPLLQNAGYKRELENLTQVDRDLLYAMRDFTQFRQQFSIKIASNYYSVLEQRDQVRNMYLSLKNSRGNIERGRAMAKEGRMTQSDLGRLEQNGLSRESAWVSAVRYYKTGLDNFKISLGVPVKTRLILDEHELDSLKIEDLGMDVEEAIRVGQAERLDLGTLADKCQDAERGVKLAAEELKPQFDLQGSRTIAGGAKAGAAQPWSIGAIVDLGLDRKAERNGYRRALVDLEKAKRTLKLQRDQVELEIRESYRSVEKCREFYEIYHRGVVLAQRRVEEQELRAELGQARAQDQVDAQNDLVDYKNQLTEALISFTQSRLSLWNNLGILYIKENGKWYLHRTAQQKENSHGKNS